MKTLQVKGLSIGEGAPKTIVSLMGATAEECLAEIEAAHAAGVDMVEWRADYAACLHDRAAMVAMGRELLAACGELPLVFTFRSTREGGSRPLDMDEYIALNQAIIEAKAADIVDIEAWLGFGAVSSLTALAHAQGLFAIVSYHNFVNTPAVEWMVEELQDMVRMGADIPKIAVMATNPEDALRLLSATYQVRCAQDVPLLTMAMGRDGALTRLVGEAFGSAITFCALQKASAPGQVDLTLAKRVMADLHQALS